MGDFQIPEPMDLSLEVEPAERQVASQASKQDKDGMKMCGIWASAPKSTQDSPKATLGPRRPDSQGTKKLKS